MNANKFMDTVTLKEYDNSGLMYCYLLTNTVNNKSYVGITNNIKRRWSDHKYSITDKSTQDKPLYRAIRKYGSDSFDIIVLSSSKSRKDISMNEIKYIKEYNTFIYPDRKGYNLTKGGENGWKARPVSKQARKNMSSSNKRLKIYKSLIRFHKENPDFAHKNVLKQWQDPKFRESRSGKNHPMSKPIVIFGVKYISITEAAEKLGRSEGYPKYHATPSKWNNFNPKEYSNSYFIS